MSDEEQRQEEKSGNAKGRGAKAAKGKGATAGKGKAGGGRQGRRAEGETGHAAAEAGPSATESQDRDRTEAADAPDGAAAAAASDRVFQPLDARTEGGAARDLEMVMDIPVNLSVELGRTRLTIKKLLELAQGSVIELDGLAGEPMDILVNGHLIAQGEVVVVEDRYGIRITEIITPSERIHKLNR